MKSNWNQSDLELLKAAVESANDAVIITDTQIDSPGPAIVYVNPAFTRMTGYRYDEIIGKTPRILQGKRTSRELLNRLRYDLTTKREFLGEGYNYRKDGSEYTVEWRITPVYALDDADRKTVKYWVAIQRDVTERRRSEEELRDADRKKDEFLATLAHELRNPLAPIRSGIQILRKKPSPEMLEKTLTMMDRQAKHIVHLVDDLIDVSRITRGKIELKIEQLDLRQIISSVIEAQQVATGNAPRLISWSVPKNAMPINGDATRVFQIVSNLLSNAVRYSEPPAPVQIELTAPDDGFLLKVRDYGIGIRPEMLNEIFDMFAQAKDVLNRPQGGLGIGLTIVKQLIEMHGGAVWAESAGEDQGATFYARFPAAVKAETMTTSDASVRAAATANDGRARVLVVDDNTDAAELVELYLTSEGFSVACSFDGRSALSALDQFRPDAVLLDIGMPGLNGFETNALIKEREQWRHLPVFALTGFGNGETVERLRAEGFARHFVKPADLEQITEELLKTLEEGSSAGNKKY